MLKKLTAVISILILLSLTLSSCQREKEGNIEFLLNKDTDTYSLVYYTDVTNQTELIIPDTYNGKVVDSIGELAINSADTLKKIVIGKNITNVDKWGITACTHLQWIEVSPENMNYASLEGVLYSKDMKTLHTYPNANQAVYEKDGKLTKTAEFTVPEGVETIAHAAFYKCFALEKINFPSTLKTIDTRAFHRCEILKEITFPEGLELIGNDAFLGCKGLTEITMPSTIKEIGEYAFYNAENITKVTFNTQESNVKLGKKWAPSVAGRASSTEIIWK